MSSNVNRKERDLTKICRCLLCKDVVPRTNLARHFEKAHKDVIKQMKQRDRDNKFKPKEEFDFTYKEIQDDERQEYLMKLEKATSNLQKPEKVVQEQRESREYSTHSPQDNQKRKSRDSSSTGSEEQDKEESYTEKKRDKKAATKPIFEITVKQSESDDDKMRAVPVNLNKKRMISLPVPQIQVSEKLTHEQINPVTKVVQQKVSQPISFQPPPPQYQQQAFYPMHLGYERYPSYPTAAQFAPRKDRYVLDLEPIVSEIQQLREVVERQQTQFKQMINLQNDQMKFMQIQIDKLSQNKRV